MNLLRTALIISAATAVNGFAPAASAPSSTRLMISTGEGGQGAEDAAMYFAPPKVGKKVATVNNSLDQFKKAPGTKFKANALQQKLMNKTTETKAAPKSKKVEEKKAKKSGIKLPWN